MQVRTVKRKMGIMKNACSIAAAGALLWLAGCASAPKATLIEPVGPGPAAPVTGVKTGSLQVYSARGRGDVDPNAAERLWDEEADETEYMKEQPHTDYSIYSAKGRFLQGVHNARESDETQPAMVTLPPGGYKIQARGEARSGARVRLTVPVVIEAGKCTAVHLEGNWTPSGHYLETEMVRLPDGQIAGWRAAGHPPTHEFSKAP